MHDHYLGYKFYSHKTSDWIWIYGREVGLELKFGHLWFEDYVAES